MTQITDSCSFLFIPAFCAILTFPGAGPFLFALVRRLLAHAGKLEGPRRHLRIDGISA